LGADGPPTVVLRFAAIVYCGALIDRSVGKMRVISLR
jgi:hypothetical protein